eukprot:gene3467-biopygen20228
MGDFRPGLPDRERNATGPRQDRDSVCDPWGFSLARGRWAGRAPEPRLLYRLRWAGRAVEDCVSRICNHKAALSVDCDALIIALCHQRFPLSLRRALLPVPRLACHRVDGAAREGTHALHARLAQWRLSTVGRDRTGTIQ